MMSFVQALRIPHCSLLIHLFLSSCLPAETHV